MSSGTNYSSISKKELVSIVEKELSDYNIFSVSKAINVSSVLGSNTLMLIMKKTLNLMEMELM